MKALGRYLRGATAAGLPFGLLMSWFFHFQFGWPIGTAAGMSAGVLFGFCFGAVAVVVSSRGLRTHPEFAGEAVLKGDAANHFVGWQVVGGGLYLTDHRILFRPHAFNLGAKEWSAVLGTVEAAAAIRLLGFMPQGLLVETQDGPHRFAVKESAAWAAAISSELRKAESARAPDLS